MIFFSLRNFNEKELETVEDLLNDIEDSITNISHDFDSEGREFGSVYILNNNFFVRKLKNVKRLISMLLTSSFDIPTFIEKLHEIYEQLSEVESFIQFKSNEKLLNNLTTNAINSSEEMDANVSSIKYLANQLRHIQSKEIYVGEANKFRRAALKYEITFYFLVFFMFMYFLGFNVYVPDFSILFFDFGFKNLSLNTNFYIQKVSILVLTTTLAAFLLKRSFTCRELYHDAYRVAQELSAIPSYIESFPKEVQDKIRLDLAYKYFGRDYKSGTNTPENENFIAENIKANTEFLKSVKDLSSSNVDKDKS